MKTEKANLNRVITILAVLGLLFAITFSGCSQYTPEEQAKAILEQSGVKGGFIVHVNCGDGVLTEALKKNNSYLVHGLDTDKDNVTKAREYITSKGNYGTVSVDSLTGNRLPYTNNMVNLVVAEGAAVLVLGIREIAAAVGRNGEGETIVDADHGAGDHAAPRDAHDADLPGIYLRQGPQERIGLLGGRLSH